MLSLWWLRNEPPFQITNWICKKIPCYKTPTTGPSLPSFSPDASTGITIKFHYNLELWNLTTTNKNIDNVNKSQQPTTWLPLFLVSLSSPTNAVLASSDCTPTGTTINKNRLICSASPLCPKARKSLRQTKKWENKRQNLLKSRYFWLTM